MTDDQHGGIGHNSGLVPFDPALINQFDGQAAIALALVAKWQKIESTEQVTSLNAPQLQKDIVELRNYYKVMDDKRAEYKAPFLEQGSLIQNTFRNPLANMAKAGGALKAIQTAFMKRKEAEENERRAAEARKAAEEARKLREEEERKHAELMEQNRQMRAEEAKAQIERRRAADAAAEEARKKEALAQKNATVNVAPAGGGRATSLRTTRICKIVDYEIAFLEFCDDDKVRDLLVQLANQRANAKGFDMNVGIPGFYIEEQRKL